MTSVSPGRRAFILQVAGLPIRYWSGAEPPATAMPGVPALDYIDVEAILNVSDSTFAIKMAGGVSENGSVVVTLKSNQVDGGAPPTDAGVILGRIGKRASHVSTELAASITQSDTLSGGILLIRGGAADLPTSDVVYIGQEALHYTGKAGDRLTGITRAVLGTHAQDHRIDPHTGTPPAVLDTIVYWRGRRATILRAEVSDTGVVGEYFEIQRGFIENSPQTSENGLVVEVSVAPLTALLDIKYSSSSQLTEVGLKAGWHYFVRGLGDQVEYVATMPARLWGLESTGSGGGGGVYNVTQIPGDYLTVFDPGAGGLNTPGHPRNGPLQDTENSTPYDVASIAGAVITLTDGAAPVLGVPAGYRITNARAREAHRARMQAGLVEWPQAARTAFAADFNPVDSTGRDGGWLTLRLADRAQSGAAIFAKGLPGCDGVGFYFTSDQPAASENTVFHWGGASAPYSSEHLLSPRQALWYGLDLALPQDTRYPQYHEGGDVTEAWLNNVPEIGLDPLTVPIRGVARGYYQTGERYLLVDNEVTVLAGTQTDLSIEYFSRADSERKTTSCRVVASTEQNHPVTGDTVGWLLDIHPADRDLMPSFGIWANVVPESDGLVTIKPTVSFTRSTAADLLLELLMSSGGNHVNDGVHGPPFYDQQPVGADLDYDDIDVESFLRISAPASLDNWTFKVSEDVTLAELITPVLQVTRSSLVMARVGNSLKLTRLPFGGEDPTQVVGSVSAGDWDLGNLPQSSVDEEVVNVFEYKVNWSEGESGRTVRIVDDESVKAYAESSPLSLDLRGLVLPANDPGTAMRILRGSYTTLSSTLGEVRKVFVGGSHSGLGSDLQVGQIYNFTSPYLRGFTDATGVVDLPARILSLRISNSGSDSEMTAVHYGTSYTGWNACLLITALAGSVLTIDPAAYGQTGDDLEHFAVGDEVWVTPAGDEDAATQHTISAIGVGTVTLSPAPANVSAPYWGDVVPAERSDASVSHVALAYLAESTTGAYSDGTPGQTYG